jgi:hypothetical protein
MNSREENCSAIHDSAEGFFIQNPGKPSGIIELCVKKLRDRGIFPGGIFLSEGGNARSGPAKQPQGQKGKDHPGI